jgi:hypothetical protein
MANKLVSVMLPSDNDSPSELLISSRTAQVIGHET